MLSSTMTIAEVKLVIFAKVDIPPIKLEVYYEETLLDDDTKTLKSYAVNADVGLSYREVRIDERKQLDIIYSSTPETGFKGTWFVRLLKLFGGNTCRSWW